MAKPRREPTSAACGFPIDGIVRLRVIDYHELVPAEFNNKRAIDAEG